MTCATFLSAGNFDGLFQLLVAFVMVLSERGQRNFRVGVAESKKDNMFNNFKRVVRFD